MVSKFYSLLPLLLAAPASKVCPCPVAASGYGADGERLSLIFLTITNSTLCPPQSRRAQPVVLGCNWAYWMMHIISKPYQPIPTDNCRFRVFYRALGPTIALVVAPGNQNAFVSMELLSQVVRVVTINGRAPELHVERVQRRFAEVRIDKGGKGQGMGFKWV